MKNVLFSSSFLFIILLIVIAIAIPNILGVILALNISLGLTLLLTFMLNSMLMEISLSFVVFLAVFCVTFFLLSPPHRELVCFVEVYCHCTVSSYKLMEMPLLHIKFPTPYNRLSPMPTPLFLLLDLLRERK